MLLIRCFKEKAGQLYGMDPSGVMAELTGRRDDYSRGKGGSMHIFSREAGFYGGHGIVVAQVPIGTGVAFTHKYRGDGGLCVSYYEDGAVNNGQVWESLNLASLWKLPVIFFIENNKYGMGTAQERASAVKNFSKTGQPFGVPGKRIDGMDVIVVKEAAELATAHARAGKGALSFGDGDLPVLGPFHVGPRQVPL